MANFIDLLTADGLAAAKVVDAIPGTLPADAEAKSLMDRLNHMCPVSGVTELGTIIYLILKALDDNGVS